MNLEMQGKLIGEGFQAKIYYYEGYAYKVFNEDYPIESINYEFNMQNEINKTNLNVVKYYKTDDDHMLKMDFIDGITISEKLRSAKGFKNGLIDIINIQKEIHKVENLNLPKVNSCYKDQINKCTVNEDYKIRAINYLDSIEEKNNLCHLDIHPLNIMYSKGEYVIIDWPNAKCGNPIHDFARTYVVLYEHAYRLSITYLSLLKKDSEIDNNELSKAIFIAALFRYNDFKNEKLIKVLEENI